MHDSYVYNYCISCVIFYSANYKVVGMLIEFDGIVIQIQMKNRYIFLNTDCDINWIVKFIKHVTRIYPYAKCSYERVKYV